MNVTEIEFFLNKQGSQPCANFFIPKEIGIERVIEIQSLVKIQAEHDDVFWLHAIRIPTLIAGGAKDVIKKNPHNWPVLVPICVHSHRRYRISDVAHLSFFDAPEHDGVALSLAVHDEPIGGKQGVICVSDIINAFAVLSDE